MDRRRLQPVDTGLNSDDFRFVELQSMLYDLYSTKNKDTELAVYLDALYWLRQAFAHTCNKSSHLGPKYAILFCKFDWLFGQ